MSCRLRSCVDRGNELHLQEASDSEKLGDAMSVS